MRTAALNGGAAFQMHLRRLGLPPVHSLFNVGSLNRLASLTEGILGDSEDILNTRTTVPAGMRLLMSQNERDALRVQLEFHEQRVRQLDYHGGRGAYRRRDRDGAYCQICAAEDLERYGFAYWHVEHLFRGVHACPRHGSLTYGCGVCKLSQPFTAAFRFPSSECSCGRAARPILDSKSQELQHHKRIAMLLFACLKPDVPYLADGLCIPTLLKHQARKLGFVRGALVDRGALTQALLERYGHRLLENFGMADSTGVELATRRVLSNRLILSSSQIALAIDFLFGSLEAFCESIASFKNVEELAPRIASRQIYPLEHSADRVKRSVARILKYRAKNPDATRSEILQNLGYATRRLQIEDQGEYEDVMPASRRTTGLRDGHVARMKLLDEALMEHVNERINLIRSMTIGPVKVSVRSLLNDHPTMKRFYEFKCELPLTSTLISSLLTSDSKPLRRASKP